MTYTFKLARRLAVSRPFVMLPAILLFAACSGDATAPESSTSPQDDWRAREAVPLTVSLNPSTVTVETNQLIRFLAHGRNGSGDSVAAPITWHATGGTILPDGRFSSTGVGTFMVTAATRIDGQEQLNTSTVKVIRRNSRLKSIEIAPDSATLASGAGHAFLATGRLGNGDAVPVGVNWTATGGTIDAGGNYIAGDTAGTYLVMATSATMSFSDSAVVTITAATPTAPAPEEPPPAPILASVTLLPGSPTLAPSAIRQFTVYGRTTTGDSVAITAVFAATGGTITDAGLYTAGNTAGTYRVIAASSGLADTSTVTITQPLGSGPAAGVPFGPYGLWANATSLNANAASFSVSLNYSDANTIVTQIGLARSKGQKLVLGMTACCRAEYATNGSFDLAKWKARQDRFNTAAIRTAIAEAVSDGTVIGAKLLDEPEHWAWGTTLSKSVVDQMATYTKSLFPTLPVGVSHGPGGFRWRTDQTYKVIDWVNYQYNWAVSGTTFAKGEAAGWRDAVLTQAAKDGVAPSFSFNLLNGGIQAARDGLWNCSTTLTQGRGTYDPNCRMTAAQVRTWGKALAPAGCMMLMWRYDDVFMNRSDNQSAFADVAQSLVGLPAKSCRRPGAG